MGEEVSGAPAAEAAPEEGATLAFTGMTAVPLALAAAGLAILGGVLIAAGRRRAGSR